MDPVAVALLAVIAAASVARLWYDRRARLLDPKATPDLLFRTKLADELTLMISPLTGLKEDLDSNVRAVEGLSETTARLETAVTDLRAAVKELRTLSQPCADCPLTRHHRIAE